MFNFGAPSPFVYRKRTPKNDRASVAKLKQVCVGLTGSETLACSLPGPLAVRPSILQLPATLDDQRRLKLSRCCISGARRLSPDACNRATPAGWCINKLGAQISVREFCGSSVDVIALYGLLTTFCDALPLSHSV